MIALSVDDNVKAGAPAILACGSAGAISGVHPAGGKT
jgi:hypothetical protein